MKGTEKQIAWATEIQVKVVSAIHVMMDGAKAQAAGHPEMADKLSKAMAAYDELLRKVTSCERAGDMIDVFRDVKDGSDWRGVLAAIKVGDPDHIFH